MSASNALETNRFIPTRAGNTGLHGIGTLHDAVHPHTRGEHAISTQCHRARSGSSPHARGTRRGVGEKESVIRFIPTRAGNTQY